MKWWAWAFVVYVTGVLVAVFLMIRYASTTHQEPVNDP